MAIFAGKTTLAQLQNMRARIGVDSEHKFPESLGVCFEYFNGRSHEGNARENDDHDCDHNRESEPPHGPR